MFVFQNYTLQTYHVYSTLKRRRKGRSHVVSMWNTRGVFVVIVRDSVRKLSGLAPEDSQGTKEPTPFRGDKKPIAILTRSSVADAWHSLKYTSLLSFIFTHKIGSKIFDLKLHLKYGKLVCLLNRSKEHFRISDRRWSLIVHSKEKFVIYDKVFITNICYKNIATNLLVILGTCSMFLYYLVVIDKHRVNP